MSYNTVWRDIETIPRDIFVIVYHPFQGQKIRQLTRAGDWYDDGEFLDDSETEWDLWTDLPPNPGPK